MDVRQSRCWAEIDCSALAANLSRLPGEPADIMAVVKADAYGHGVELAAPALLAAGVRSFGVATVEEGRQLRSLPGFEAADYVAVYVMTAALAADAPQIVESALIPFVSDFALASALSDAAAEASATVPVHIEVDTGIGRAGIAPADLAAFFAECRVLPGVTVTGVCTHFTAADSADGPADALAQYALFEEALAALSDDDLAGLTLHAANSPAIERLTVNRDSAGGPAFAGRHLLRPGLLLYGIGPSAEMEGEGGFGYRPVLALKARVMLVRRLPVGSDISYSRTYRLPREANIATIAIGYGDGFPRRLSNCGEVLLPSGRRAPIRGRVCMDQLCIELADDDALAPGDIVTLIGKVGGEEIRIATLAAQIDATPHELSTCLTARVPRIGV